jgi:hypothetical protein
MNLKVSFEVHTLCLRRIVQLTNSAALHLRNWSFTIKSLTVLFFLANVRRDE